MLRNAEFVFLKKRGFSPYNQDILQKGYDLILFCWQNDVSLPLLLEGAKN